jgi:hypothetical protein
MEEFSRYWKEKKKLPVRHFDKRMLGTGCDLLASVIVGVEWFVLS